MKAKLITQTKNRGKSKASKVNGRTSEGQRVKAKQALPITSAQIAKLLEQISDGFVALDKDWRYIYVNQKAAEMLQRKKPSDLIGKHIWTEYPEGVGQPFQLAYEKAMKEKTPIVIEDYYEPWGRWFENRIYPSVDILCILFTEITERKRVEEALRESEQKFSKIFYASPVPVSINRVSDGRYVEVNQSFLKRMGYKREEVIGHTALEIDAWLDPARRPEMLEILHGQGSLSEFEAKFRTKSGEVGIALLFREVIELAGEKHFIGTTLDITERKQVEEALLASGEQYRALFETAPVGIGVADQTGRLLAFNNAMLQPGGYTREEIQKIGSVQGLYYDQSQRAAVLALFEKQGFVKQYPIQFVRKDGTSYDTLLTLTPIRFEGKPCVQALVEDITDRKQAEDALYESKQRFKSLSEAAFEGIMIHDMGTIIDANQAFADLFGYSRPEDLIGLNGLQVLPFTSESLELIKRNIGSSSTKPFDITIQGQDGSLLHAETQGRDITIEGRKLRVVAMRDISERKRAEEEIRQRLGELQGLYETSNSISAEHDLNTLLGLIVENAKKLLNAASSGMYLCWPESEELELTVDTEPYIPFGSRLHFGEGLAGRVAQTRRPLRVDDYSTWEGRSSLYEGTTLRAVLEVPMLYKGELIGVLTADEVGESTRKFTEADERLLSLFASQAAGAIHSARLRDDLQRSNIDLISAYDATIEGWSRAMDLRDKETEGHTLRVTEMTLDLVRAMNISKSELTHVRRGALLHDIGKLGVPDKILLNPDKLTDEEWKVMHDHPTYAYEMLSSITYLKSSLDIPYCHHEKWDGSGYPRGLKGEQIPLAARIFAIVDVWDAITSDRPYRPAWSKEKAMGYIQEQSGKHFDPEVVGAFLSMMADY